MDGSEISGLDRALARLCVICPACRYARKKGLGIVFRLVKQIESGVCPFCRAYGKVHGRKAHERVPPE